MKRFFLTVFFSLLLLTNFVLAQKTDAEPPTWANKLYSQMGEDEKLRFVAAESDDVLALFGRTKGDEISPEGLKAIRNHLDGYVRRINKPKFDSCASKDWTRSDLTSVLKRGSAVSAAISEEFSALDLPPEIGIYVAMIETDFCPCLQSPIGTLGMFQFTTALAANYGLKTQKGATTAKPDERCEPKLAARAASKYFKFMIDKIFGSDAVGYPLAIGAFNRGEGATKRHIADVTAISKAPRISFWVLIDTQETLIEKLEKDAAEKSAEESKLPLYLQQFQAENIKYVPKFFAAAIVGENPKTFGIDLPPLSRAK
jgi:hypothetical protein